MNEALKRLYQDVIVQHSKAPRNYGELPEASHAASASSPLCGDEITVRAVVAGGRIADIRFEARGCVLSRAAASLMTEAVRGRAIDGALALGRDLEGFVSGPPAPGAAERLGELTVFEGVRDFPSRTSCVTLPWQALERALASRAGAR